MRPFATTAKQLLTDKAMRSRRLDNCKPIVKIRKGRKSGKPTKRYLSLRRFQKVLGMTPTETSSGDKK